MIQCPYLSTLGNELMAFSQVHINNTILLVVFLMIELFAQHLFVKEVDEAMSSSSQLSQRFAARSAVDLNLEKYMLNNSQLNAVADCVLVSEKISSPIKLIWGPPRTGKTKTISALLWVMLHSGHRTLTCAPTNTAVLEVASRIVKLVHESPASSGQYLSDIVLFGNKKRMKIGEDHDLSVVFLSSRTERLSQCFESMKGWNHCLCSLIDFLEIPVTKKIQVVHCSDENERTKFSSSTTQGICQGQMQ